MDRKTVRPIAEGFRPSELIDARGIVRKYALPLGKAEALSCLQPEYVFFTPAILYLYGALFDGLWLDHMTQFGSEVKLYHHRFQRPIFRGLEVPGTGNKDWNNVLWAVEAGAWPDLAAFLLSSLLTDRPRRRVTRYGEQALTVQDPLVADRQGLWQPATPRIPIYAYGVNGSLHRAAFEPTEPPRLKFFPPDAQIVREAKMLFRGDNPLDVKRTA